jgi:hypothetical protein
MQKQGVQSRLIRALRRKIFGPFGVVIPRKELVGEATGQSASSPRRLQKKAALELVEGVCVYYVRWFSGPQ